MNKQLRIPFPDYTPEEQERDAAGLKLNEIYFMKVKGEWGALMPRKYGNVIFNAGKTPFVEFVKGIIEDYPFYKLRCVQNEGIAEKIAEYQDAAMLRDAASHKQAAPALRGSLLVSRGMDEGR